jgi:hypothetical protein
MPIGLDDFKLDTAGPVCRIDGLRLAGVDRPRIAAGNLLRLRCPAGERAFAE